MSKTPFPIRIRSRIAELERSIVEAQTELDELRVAERVIARLGSTGDMTDQDSIRPSMVKSTTNSAATISSKIVEVLALAGPMNSGQLLMQLQEKWRPDLSFPTVSSTLSRIKAQNLVVKNGDQWSVPQKDEAPSANAPEPQFIPQQGDQTGAVKSPEIGASE
jgi:hypothetical protein